MSKMTSLIKMQLNMNFGISLLKHRFTKEKTKRWESVAIGLAAAFGLGSLLVLYIFFMAGMFMAGKSLNHPEMILTMAFLASQMVVLVFGIFYIIGSFYFSHDIETLVPLPLRPYEVIGSKFVILMINEYITALPILLPPLLIYGIGTSQGFFYWIKGIVLILAAPAIPLTLAALFVMLLMRMVNLRRNKDLFAIIGGFIGLFLALSLNLFIQKMPKTGGGEFFKSIGKSGFVELIGNKFPPSVWATYGLSENTAGGFLYFLLFIAVSILLFMALLWLSNFVFYKALLAGQEASRKKKVISGKEYAKLYSATSSPIVAILIREWKLLLRTPVYVINGLAGMIVGPFILVMLFFVQNSDPDAIEILKLINNPQYKIYIVLGGLGLMLFTSGMNLVASTSVSREGNTLWILKMIPVTARRQVFAKFLQSLSVSFLGLVTTDLVLGIFLKIQPGYLLLLFVLGILGSIPIAALSLLLDVLNPKFTWNSEQEAMKQNLNGVLGMFVSVIIIAVFGVATVIPLLAGLPYWLVFTVLAIVEVGLGALSLFLLYFTASRKYIQYEA